MVNSKEPKEGVETIMVVEGWNQHVYKTALKVNILLALALLILVPLTVIGLLKEPEPRYFATNTQGGLVEIISLSQPNLSKQAVTQWAVDAMTESYTMDYANYKTQVAKSTRTYFTNAGSTQFKKALQDSGNLDALIKKRMVFSTVVTSTPIIEDQGEFNGVYSWRLSVPIRVTFQNSEGKAVQDLLAKLIIVRESTLEKSKGVGISQFLITSNK